METKIIAYIIERKDYDMFDEILTFLTENGQKITCFAPGTRKILSKNGRNIFIGSSAEVVFFKARTENKMSKLKKIWILKYFPWDYRGDKNFLLLSELMEKTVFFSLDTFTFYQYCVDAISLESLPENLLTLVILEKYLKLSGVNFETAKCVGCEESNFTNISLKMHGFVCEKCDKEKNKYPPEVIKCFYYLFEEEYMKIEKFLTEGTYVQLIHLLKKYILDNLGIKISSL